MSVKINSKMLCLFLAMSFIFIGLMAFGILGNVLYSNANSHAQYQFEDLWLGEYSGYLNNKQGRQPEATLFISKKNGDYEVERINSSGREPLIHIPDFDSNNDLLFESVVDSIASLKVTNIDYSESFSIAGDVIRSYDHGHIFGPFHFTFQHIVIEPQDI